MAVTPAETPVLRRPLARRDWRRLVCTLGEAEPDPYVAAWSRRRDQAEPSAQLR